MFNPKCNQEAKQLKLLVDVLHRHSIGVPPPLAPLGGVIPQRSNGEIPHIARTLL